MSDRKASRLSSVALYHNLTFSGAPGTMAIPPDFAKYSPSFLRAGQEICSHFPDGSVSGPSRVLSDLQITRHAQGGRRARPFTLGGCRNAAKKSKHLGKQRDGALPTPGTKITGICSSSRLITQSTPSATSHGGQLGGQSFSRSKRFSIT